MIRKYIIAAAALVAAGSTAMAADISYDAAPVPAQSFNWTGFYVGLTGGAATGDMDLFAVGDFEDGTFSISSSGFIGGVQVGYNWQFENNFVLGAVADISASNYGSSIETEGFELFDLELKYLGTVRARAGYAWDRALVYAHGGFAYGKVEASSTFEGDISANHSGWTIGAGVEYALTDKISFGTEYSYVDLGDEVLFSGFDDGEGFEPGTGVDVKFHTVKAMINFRF
jgi:outer membrane immunogenic protein